MTKDTLAALALLASLDSSTADRAERRDRAAEQRLLAALDDADFDLFQALARFWPHGD